MSLLPILWAMKNAPVTDAEERVILIALAETAWSDGTDAFPSKKTLAEISVLDPKTVQRRLRSLAARKVIALGNQAAAAYIPEWYRPNVYDLLIPFSWYPDVEQVNAERKRRGKAPLTPQERPDLAPAPPKKQRADKGKPRKKRVVHKGGGDYKTPPADTVETGQEGGSTRPPGGDYKSQTPGLQDPQPSPYNPPRDTPRPSFPAAASDERPGGKDGSEMSNQSPGVNLLLAIGAENPKFLLTGKTLTDQGLTVTGMLLEGWTEPQLRQVIAGRPLPDQVKTSVGAIVARRLRDAIAGPPPGSAPLLPSQAAPWAHEATEETWTPPQWSARQGLDVAVATLHRAKCSECHRPLRDSAKDTLCRDCREDATA
ncbi:helix-turn-helix domain-containing protein [Streptomyces sp. NPDC056227]|uniref:helix-turn-helix domain-containing protein n=1 Tax=Streptomyces sp. NPDC056227 TaxID=3345753 RepID=UPI0035E0963F